MVNTSQKSKVENFEQIVYFLNTQLAYAKSALGVGP